MAGSGETWTAAVIALLRYQTANLFRSHRWIFPLIAYALLISVGGAGSGSRALADGLDWSAAILVPVVALLTRSMLTAEPGAARACVFAARGPWRGQLATLLTAFAGGAVLGLAGAAYELATAGHETALLVPLAVGLGKALVCALVGSAVGTLFNPPLIRHPAAALLSDPRRCGRGAGVQRLSGQRRAARRRRGDPVRGLASGAPAAGGGRAGRCVMDRILLAGRPSGGLKRPRRRGRRRFWRPRSQL